MLAIFKLSLHRLYSSLFFWVLLAITQFVLAWSFLIRLELWLNRQDELSNSTIGVSDYVLTPLFQLALTLVAVSLPFITAQHFAGEKQQNNWALMMTAPITKMHIVLGKFLSLMVLCCIFLLMVWLMCLSLSAHTSLDYGQLLSSSLLFLLACSLLCMLGLFVSACMQQYMAAAITTLGVFIFLLNTHWLNIDASQASPVLDWLSIKQHMANAYRGWLNTYDLWFFISGSVVLYVLTCLKVDHKS